MNRRLLTTCLVASAGIFVLTACGGGGLLGTSGATMSLSANKVQVAYGQQVTISWSSSGMEHVDADRTNFVVGPATVDGSLVDTPSHDTTYKLTLQDENGDRHERTVTVNVTKAAKKIAVVADSAIAGVPQMRDFIQGITTTPVTVTTGIPSLSGVDVLVILESASVGPSQISTIGSFLNSGGSVVLAGRAPAKLATGDINHHDLSAIGSWFAGVTQRYGAGGIPNIVETSPVGFPLSTVILGDRIHRNTNLTVATVTASAYRLTDATDTACGGFAYKPSSGGKVGFVAAAPIGNTPEETSLRYLLLTVCRWAADGS